MHSAEEPCIAEELLDRLVPALLRAGTIPAETLLELAEQMDREAQCCSVEREEQLGRMASALRSWVIDSTGQTRSDWEAERRRGRFSVIDLDAER